MVIKKLEGEELTTPEFSNHKAVYRFSDESSGLKGYVAIHNDVLGSAVGGTRFFPYQSEAEALADVLKLSRAMSYKCALAGVAHGGGKAVIIGDPKKDKSPALLKAYAEAIDSLQGAFHTGEDVGISEADVQYALQFSPFFIGRSGQASDPSPFAALSTFYCIQTALNRVYGSSDLTNKKVAVKGVGKLGGELARLLLKAGAQVVAADIDIDRTSELQSLYPAISFVSPHEIHKQSVDVYAPCALGNEFSAHTLADVRAKIICGGANNQLANMNIGDALFEKGITYVPDYVANSGGVIDVVDELEAGGFNADRVVERIHNVTKTLEKIFTLSAERHEPPHRVADALAEELFTITV